MSIPNERRYSRQIVLSEIGQEGQKKLSEAKVLIVGAGGLGCPVLQYLVGAGVGKIGIIDFDTVEVSNLQRQILYGVSDIGKNKAEAAKKRLEDLNPEIIIQAFSEKLTLKNAKTLFEEYDIIVDGSDNFSTRYLVNDVSVITGKPFVYGGVYKFEGQVSVFNYQNSPSYRCLFPNFPKEDALPNCSEIGVLGVLPGTIGSMQANEVLKIILNIGTPLAGKLLCYNALSSRINILSISRLEEQIQKVKRNKTCLENIAEEYVCKTILSEISISEALKKNDIQFIDVREFGELPEILRISSLQIPLSELKNNMEKISQKGAVFFCLTGGRAKKAVEILKKHHVKECFSLKEGAFEMKEYLENI